MKWVIIIVAIMGLSALSLTSFYILRPNNGDEGQTQGSLQDFLKLKLKEDFWPQEYNVVKDESDLVRLGFGRRYALNYSTSWSKRDSYFLVFVGYDKNQPDQFIGYTLNIYVRGVTPKGRDMAQIFLKDVPTQGWIRSEPRVHDRFTSEVSNILWKEGRNKLYLSVLSLSYKEPEPGFFPDESVKEVTGIRLRIYTPENWAYNSPEEFQQADHSIYGQ